MYSSGVALSAKLSFPLSAAGSGFTISNMTSLVEIKAAIDRLSPREYCELMSMLRPSADDGWDRQIAADLAAGRLDGLIANSKAEIEAGLAVPLETILEEAERVEGRS
jgi:hypothetical protein